MNHLTLSYSYSQRLHGSERLVAKVLGHGAHMSSSLAPSDVRGEGRKGDPGLREERICLDSGKERLGFYG